jgi:hypothetical protein
MRDMPSHPTSAAGHERHDPFLVSRLATDDHLEPDERSLAAALVSGCPDCRELEADLRSISRAVAAERVPARPRDFRLAPLDAARLRGGFGDRLLARLRVPDLAHLRPLAGSALALGLLLVVVGAGVPVQQVPASDPAMTIQAPSGPAADVVGEPDPVMRSAPEALEAAPEAPDGAPEAFDAAGPEAADDVAPPDDLVEMRALEAGASPAPDDAVFSVPSAEDADGPGAKDVPGAERAEAPDDALARGPDREAASVTGEVTTVAAAASDGRGVAIVLGIILALLGLVVAWLSWMARTEDPLLR